MDVLTMFGGKMFIFIDQNDGDMSLTNRFDPNKTFINNLQHIRLLLSKAIAEVESALRQEYPKQAKEKLMVALSALKAQENSFASMEGINDIRVVITASKDYYFLKALVCSVIETKYVSTLNYEWEQDRTVSYSIIKRIPIIEFGQFLDKVLQNENVHCGESKETGLIVLKVTLPMDLDSDEDKVKYMSELFEAVIDMQASNWKEDFNTMHSL